MRFAISGVAPPTQPTTLWHLGNTAPTWRSHGVMIAFAASGTYWPIAILCPSLGPFPSIGGGAHRLLTTL